MTENYYTKLNSPAARVLVVGIMPPPHGGISVHIARVQASLTAQGHQVQVIDVVRARQQGYLYYLRLLLVAILWDFKPQIVYYHVLVFWRFPLDLIILLAFRVLNLGNFKIINIEHVARYLATKSWVYKKIISWVLKFVDQQVLMGQPSYDHYLAAGWLTKNFSLESPFVTPDLKLETQILAQYPPELFKFLDSYGPIVLVNASRVSFWQNIDLYGLDMAIALLDHLCSRASYENTGLIIAISNLDQPTYIQKIISASKYPKHILLLTGAYELWPLTKRVDLFIRPTIVDTFGISVAEARIFNIPTLASAVCQRAVGTVCFKARDQIALNFKANELLRATYVPHAKYPTTTFDKLCQH